MEVDCGHQLIVRLIVVVLKAKSNSYEDLVPLMDRTNAALGDVVSGEAIRLRA
jgi:hypothetical protein